MIQAQDMLVVLESELDRIHKEINEAYVDGEYDDIDLDTVLDEEFNICIGDLYNNQADYIKAIKFGHLWFDIATRKQNIKMRHERGENNNWFYVSD